MSNTLLLKKLLSIKAAYYFALIVVISLTCEFIIKKFLLTEAVYYNTYSDQLSKDMVSNIFLFQKKMNWLTYLFDPITRVVSICYDSIFVFSLIIIKYEKTNFSSVFNICLKSAIIFNLMDICRILNLLLFDTPKTLFDLNRIPFSLLDLIKSNESPHWLIYVLQNINIWDLLYCILGSALMSVSLKVKFKNAIVDFILPHFLGVLFWLTLATFLIIEIS
ncbi:MAG: hypothetical protein ABUL44_02250 [Flavobacterium sp.]